MFVQSNILPCFGLFYFSSKYQQRHERNKSLDFCPVTGILFISSSAFSLQCFSLSPYMNVWNERLSFKWFFSILDDSSSSWILSFAAMTDSSWLFLAHGACKQNVSFKFLSAIADNSVANIDATSKIASKIPLAKVSNSWPEAKAIRTLWLFYFNTGWWTKKLKRVVFT